MNISLNIGLGLLGYIRILLVDIVDGNGLCPVVGGKVAALKVPGFALLDSQKASPILIEQLMKPNSMGFAFQSNSHMNNIIINGNNIARL
jgi:hypothetical protein